MTKSWRPKDWAELRLKFLEDNMPPPEKTSTAVALISAMEVGADAMHKADVKWLIERIIHDDRGYVFKMSDREWQEFLNGR